MLDPDGTIAARHEHLKQLLFDKIDSVDDFRNVWNGTHKAFFYHLPKDVELSFISPAVVRDCAFLCLSLTVPCGVTAHFASFRFEIFDVSAKQLGELHADNLEINRYGAGSQANTALPISGTDYSDEEICLRIAPLTALPGVFLLFLPPVSVNGQQCCLDPIAFYSDADTGLRIAGCTVVPSEEVSFL